MSDVENALSARSQLAERAHLLQESLDVAREVERLYETCYRAGAVALRFWLDAQETRHTAQAAVDENRLQRLRN